MWLYFSGLADSRFGFLLGYCFPAKVSSFKIASYFHGTFKRPNLSLPFSHVDKLYDKKKQLFPIFNFSLTNASDQKWS